MGSPFFLQEASTFLAVDSTTTSLTPVALVTLNITTLSAASALIIFINGAFSNNTSDVSVHGQLSIDGVVVANTKSNCRNTANTSGNAGIVWRTAFGALAAGAHTISFDWFVSSGTARCAPNTQSEFCDIQAWEVSQ